MLDTFNNVQDRAINAAVNFSDGNINDDIFASEDSLDAFLLLS